ncbi:methylmalonyl-CoA mutase small subunit [Pleomorphomonas sp. SM30]|uniref:Heterodimeric methylmalonyl-CoA mutase small subunit n=3 Tax=Oharaeibacter diazotrophicus TaxID=1920512 RepID=A0A4R6RB62_9HYPH|nr:heterodimeric methylmalonyl-CoA mutase small subunit [Oharaeibacter diazotrophicus]BBE72102.1 methylmalonyl-CoA mutase small subunit [Pleomorphomonas sp. SM30]GLS78867.1 methylmalonyl-CoA mutase [Oharaeibacter diazotrophicus]
MDLDLEQFGDIPPVTREAWDAAVAKALGTSTLDRLRAVTADGIAVPPLTAPRSDRDPLPARGPGNPWSIVQRVRFGDPAATNARILDELAGGADAIDLVLPSPPDHVVVFDDADEGRGKLIRAFASVYLDMVTVHLTGGAGVVGAAEALLSIADGTSPGRSTVKLRLGHDPIADQSLKLSVTDAEAVVAAHLARLASLAPRCNPEGSLLAASGQPWHALGASEAQQVALALASALTFVRLADAADLPDLGPERLAGALEFRLVADQNQFLTIAKLRAFRRLWALVTDELGLPARPAFVHAEPAWRTMTRRDPWVNILRSTVACFAAAVGGADAVTTVPHTDLIGMPDDAARRLSRNVQAVLMDESNLHMVADPAAGAGAIEALTDSLAERAWDEFRAIEAEGGLLASLAAGAVTGRIAAVDKARRTEVARRRLPITGTSTYPLLAERTPEVLDGPPAPAPVAGARRLAEPWEALRDRSDRALAEAGVRPRVFLANLGPVAAFTARTTFAKNLFEAGGVEAVAGAGGDDVVALAAAFRASGAALACLCSDDRTYEAFAAPAAEALKAAGARVLLAGRPKEAEAALRAAGVDDFVFDGMDALALLEGLHTLLETPAA